MGKNNSRRSGTFCKRSEWLVDRIATYLINEFTLTTLQSMSVLEVGSYDGWFSRRYVSG